MGNDVSKPAGDFPDCKCLLPCRRLRSSTRNLLCNHWFYACRDPMYGCNFRQWEDPPEAYTKPLPRCDCGFPCAGDLCSKLCPDVGRPFYSCGKPDGNLGCKFFLWGDGLENEDGRPYCYCGQRTARRQTTLEGGKKGGWFFGCQNWKSHVEPGCGIVLFKAALAPPPNPLEEQAPLCECQVSSRPLQCAARNLRCNHWFYACRDPVRGCRFLEWADRLEAGKQPVPRCYCGFECCSCERSGRCLFVCGRPSSENGCQFLMGADQLEDDDQQAQVYCYCDHRSIRQQVQKQGCNRGRWFYSCPHWTPTNPSCCLFLWEDGSCVAEGEGDAVRLAEDAADTSKESERPSTEEPGCKSSFEEESKAVPSWKVKTSEIQVQQTTKRSGPKMRLLQIGAQEEASPAVSLPSESSRHSEGQDLKAVLTRLKRNVQGVLGVHGWESSEEAGSGMTQSTKRSKSG